ncbi:hypothetical protein SCA6_011299 [Theobroma cacao]
MTFEEFLQMDHSKLQHFTFVLKKTSHKEAFLLLLHIKDFYCTEGWHYNGCKICMKTLQHIVSLFFPLIMTVQDHTRCTTFVVFGMTLDKYVLLKPIAKLIDKQKLFNVTLVTKSLKTGDLSFKIQSCSPPNEYLNLVLAIRKPSTNK